MVLQPSDGSELKQHMASNEATIKGVIVVEEHSVTCTSDDVTGSMGVVDVVKIGDQDDGYVHMNAEGVSPRNTVWLACFANGLLSMLNLILASAAFLPHCLEDSSSGAVLARFDRPGVLNRCPRPACFLQNSSLQNSWPNSCSAVVINEETVSNLCSKYESCEYRNKRAFPLVVFSGVYFLFSVVSIS